jgi:hypothetical protein
VAQVRQAADVLLHLTSFHLADFPLAVEPIIPMPMPTNVASLSTRLQQEAVRAIPLWQLGVRRDARRAAALSAPVIAADTDTRANAEYRAAVKDAADRWRMLTANDPHTVLEELEAAFADNESPAVPLSCVADQVDLVVLFPDIDLVPAKRATTTPGGKPTLKAWTKSERNTVYVGALGSTVLATVKEAFAVAPGINRASVAVVRRTRGVPSGVIYAGRFSRAGIGAFNWQRVDFIEELGRAEDALFVRSGVTAEVKTIDLAPHPELKDLFDAVNEVFSTPQIPSGGTE